jgi:hypothetical protein
MTLSLKIKQTLWKIVLFMAIFAFLVLAINGLLIKGLRKLDIGDYGIWNGIMEGKINAQILITGSSRTLVHFDSDIIHAAIPEMNCYNIGLDGSPINLQLPYFETYLKHNANPQIIIQGLDITLLNARKDIHNPQMYLPYLDEDTLYNCLSQIDRRFYWYKHVPLYGFALADYGLKELAISGLMGIEQKEYRFNGFMPVDKTWQDEFKKFKEQNPEGISYPIEDECIADLRSLLTIARDRNIRVILVYSPEYYENYPLTLNRAEIFATFRKIAADYQVPLWDYSGIPLCHDTTYFYNSQHLNRRGADAFSKIFAEDLRNYIDINLPK